MLLKSLYSLHLAFMFLSSCLLSRFLITSHQMDFAHVSL